MKKKFKVGDKVRLDANSVSMTVLRYASIKGKSSNYCVECWWYDDKWGYLTAIFHQNQLQKYSSNKQNDSLLRVHSSNQRYSNVKGNDKETQSALAS